MTRVGRTVFVMGTAAGLFFAAARGAAAQNPAGTTIAPSLIMGGGYDDNLFWSTSGAADYLFRVTPGLVITRESPRATWFGTYSYDAERYDQYRNLTTPVARQNGSLVARLRPTPATTLNLSGGYDSTLTAAELNVTTRIGLDRLSARRWYGGPEITHAFGRRMTLDVSYLFTNDVILHTDSIDTHAVDVVVSREMSSRHTARVKLIERRFVFNGRDPIDAPAALFGWTHKITPYTSWTINAGPRFAESSVRPEIEASLARRTSVNETVLSFDRTLTSAVGLVGVVDIQRTMLATSYHLPHRMDANVQAGTYWNRWVGLDATVYRLSADVTKHLTGLLSVSVSYGVDAQHGVLGPVGGPLLATTEDAADFAVTAPAPGKDWIRRNVMLFRVLIAPDVRVPKPMAPPNDGGSDEGRSR